MALNAKIKMSAAVLEEGAMMIFYFSRETRSKRHNS
jgi:hypothetical protein